MLSSFMISDSTPSVGHADRVGSTQPDHSGTSKTVERAGIPVVQLDDGHGQNIDVYA